MMDRYDDAMKAARTMVGINELEMARKAATEVFVRHGGRYDRDSAPIPGRCQRCHSSADICSMQRLAFAVLLMGSVFETTADALVDKVLDRIGVLVRQQGNIAGEDIDGLRANRG